jgi:hypothetical protein
VTISSDTGAFCGSFAFAVLPSFGFTDRDQSTFSYFDEFQLSAFNLVVNESSAYAMAFAKVIYAVIYKLIFN